MNNKMPSGAQLPGVRLPDARLLLLLAVCLALNACVMPRGSLGAGSPAQAAQQQAERGHYRRAAEFYAAAARQQKQPAKRAALRLQGATAALRAERTDLARRLLDAINPAHFSQADLRRYELARTLVNIAPMAPKQALAELPPPSGAIGPDLAALVWKTRAELLFEKYQYVAGIHSLVQRSVWLLDEQAIRRNNELIFQRALEAVKLGRGADSPAAQGADATTLGWLRLAEIKLRGPSRATALEQVLNRWEDRFTGHPATRGLLLRQFSYQPYSSPLPRPHTGDGLAQGPILLFLPLSGELARPAAAIRAGFEMAYSNSSATRALRVVDSTGLTAGEIIQRARAARAALIVGPLKKSKVAALARQAPRIPVLALNQVHGPATPPWFYRYALAPEDDARAAAAYAGSRGWQRALALVPLGPWGSRVLDAFRNAFRRRGGRLIDYARFDPDRFDHQHAVQSVLQTRGPGEPADFVFIAARPAHARLLRSQLRFYRAARLPVVATSDAYSGVAAPRKDMDLNGVTFAVIPWIIGTGPMLNSLHRRARSRPGYAAKRFPRLFAMGIDAWRLSIQLARGGLPAGTALEGVTGVLEVQPDHSIRRHLAWARFVNGRAQLLAPAGANAPTRYRADTPSNRAWPNAETGPARARPVQRTRQPPQDYGPVYSRDGQQHDRPRQPRQPEAQPAPTSDYGPVYSAEPGRSQSY